MKDGKHTQEVKPYLKDNIVKVADDYALFECINSNHYLPFFLGGGKDE